MKDEEVGEIWAKAKLPVVRALIVKLVEERAAFICMWKNDRQLDDGHLAQALHDFGIDESTWPKEGT